MDHPTEQIKNAAIQAYMEHMGTGNMADIRVKSFTIVTPDGQTVQDDAADVFEFMPIAVCQTFEEAMQRARHAMELRPKSHPQRLSLAGNNIGSQFERTDDIDNPEEAIQTGSLAVEVMPKDHPDRPMQLTSLGISLWRRYERTGNMDDLQEAIVIIRRAIELTPRNHPDRAGQLSNLGLSLGSLFERNGDLVDLEDAIQAGRQSIALAPADLVDRAGMINNLGVNLERRYERHGDMGDLVEAIQMMSQAIETTSTSHPARAVLLDNLGNQLARRYESTGKMNELEMAIQRARQAIELTPENHPEFAKRLAHLGNKLVNRFKRTSEIHCLEEAIDTVRKAIQMTPDGHYTQAIWSNNLGNNLERRYERTGNIDDLQEALYMARQAIKLTPADHPNQPVWLDNLALKLANQYRITGDLDEIQLAIQTARRAVELTPQDHPERSKRLGHLGLNVGSRYDRTGDVDDLQEAIRLARQAIELIPKDHPDQAMRLSDLGNRLSSRYNITDDMKDLEAALAYLWRAWDCETAVPFHRIRAASRCLDLLAKLRRVKHAIQLGHDIIDLLPTVNTKLLTWADQQFVMTTFAGVAANLCAFFLESDNPEQALQYLEKGRAIIIAQLIDSRSDVSFLALQHPEMARRYNELRDEINTPIISSKLGVIERPLLRRRKEAVAELNKCIEEIRTIPDQEQFLLGQTATEMQECAAEGSIIVINVTEFRSDAIIVSANGIRTLHLPKLSASESKTWLGKNWAGRRSERLEKNKEFSKYLAWLWFACVREVLEEVNAIHLHRNVLPRIWWIGTGLASSMPFHAAGLHSADSTENSFSKAISSYIPSIKALAYARSRARRTDVTNGSLLMVTMPTTPGAKSDPRPPDLDGVMEEKDKVVEATVGYLPTDLLNHPSVDQVMERLQQCCIAHFACHGYADHIDPSNSGLILQKHGEHQVAEQDRLTVRMISELSLSNARIAYLSSCSTAANKAAGLSDEVIHLVSGFQLAGFPHVVGCLWPSNDRVCVQVAGAFYTALLAKRGKWWDNAYVALALREAVMSIRATEIKLPLNWAQFVHYGV